MPFSLTPPDRVGARIVMRDRPTGRLERRHFERLDGPLRNLLPGEILLENILLSVAPAARALMQTDTYRKRLTVGETIPSTAIGRVIESSDGGLATGTLVATFAGWEEYSIVASAQARVLDEPAPLEHYLGALGQNGLTAYFGMREIGDVSRGQTVVVSGAAGGVGHVAGQIARILGARVVGITSSPEKNDVLTSELGFHAAVDRSSDTFAEDLASATPDGVDVYFDTVGGAVTEHVLQYLNRHAKIVCCGATSTYADGADSASAPSHLLLTAITKSLRLEGFLVNDFRERWPEATTVMNTWMTDGLLSARRAISPGLDSAPEALVQLLEGHNIGQSGVRLRPDPMAPSGNDLMRAHPWTSRE